MKFIRVKSYHNGKFTGAEWLCFGDNQVKALERCRSYYPEHNDCVFIAETIDDSEPKWKEYVKVCNRCSVLY